MHSKGEGYEKVRYSSAFHRNGDHCLVLCTYGRDVSTHYVRETHADKNVSYPKGQDYTLLEAIISGHDCLQGMLSLLQEFSRICY